MKNLSFSDWVLIAVLAAVSILFFNVLAPLFLDIVIAIVLVSLFWELNRKLRGSTGPRIASILSMLVLLLIIIVPTVIIGTYAVNEANPAVASMQQNLPQIQQQLSGGSIQRFIQNTPVLRQLSQYISPSALVNIVYSFVTQALSYTTNFLQFMISQASQFVFHLFVTFVLIYFLFLRGDTLVNRLNRVVALHHSVGLLESSQLAVNAVLIRSIVSGLIHFVLGWVLFALFGVPYALLWAVAMIPLAFFPILGNALVYLVAGAYKLAIGDTFLGIVLLLVGFIVPPLIDRFIRPMFMGEREVISPGLLIVSALGGGLAFGFLGIIIGPVAAALFVVAWEYISVELKGQETTTPVEPAEPTVTYRKAA
ncbi:MAG: hypothetical protein A2X42_00430 [Candidatus Margulisbacteria bacterium GWF2_38_17]|nr:MAG: hypothetical protein A2X43_10075 [Candidatus Margulisbacteria bacterium GWD2_39_127]OGI03088.1 MAG: hypothetical protein A2X42_00430 [Candidatus Margulisbacteria bacterium GWF2_38_17]